MKKRNIFNETIVDILRSNIPPGTVLCDYRYPPWLNNKNKKSLICKETNKRTKKKKQYCIYTV